SRTPLSARDADRTIVSTAPARSRRARRARVRRVLLAQGSDPTPGSACSRTVSRIVLPALGEVLVQLVQPLLPGRPLLCQPIVGREPGRCAVGSVTRSDVRLTAAGIY